MTEEERRKAQDVKEVLDRTSDLATQLRESVDDLKLLLVDYGKRKGAQPHAG